MSWNRRSQIYWLDRIGMWVLRVSIIGLVALVTVQLLMTNDPFRLYMGLNQTMGEQVTKNGEAARVVAPKDDSGEKKAEVLEAIGTVKGDATLTLRLTDYESLEKLTVKVNGREAGSFSQKEVNVELKNGDILEIDSTAYPYPLDIVFTKTSNNLLYPKANQGIIVKKEVARVGPVKIKK